MCIRDSVDPEDEDERSAAQLALGDPSRVESEVWNTARRVPGVVGVTHVAVHVLNTSVQTEVTIEVDHIGRCARPATLPALPVAQSSGFPVCTLRIFT